MITVLHKDMVHHLDNEAFYSHVLTLHVDGNPQKVILRDLQRHPVKPVVMHADFLRVDEKSRLTMHVPLHFINEENAIGVKQQGGMVAHLASDVEISCLAKDLPEYIEVDLADLEAGESLHLSQIKVPEGVELVEVQLELGHAVPGLHVQLARSAFEDVDHRLVVVEDVGGEAAHAVGGGVLHGALVHRGS